MSHRRGRDGPDCEPISGWVYSVAAALRTLLGPVLDGTVTHAHPVDCPLVQPVDWEGGCAKVHMAVILGPTAVMSAAVLAGLLTPLVLRRRSAP